MVLSSALCKMIKTISVRNNGPRFIPTTEYHTRCIVYSSNLEQWMRQRRAYSRFRPVSNNMIIATIAAHIRRQIYRLEGNDIGWLIAFL